MKRRSLALVLLLVAGCQDPPASTLSARPAGVLSFGEDAPAPAGAIAQPTHEASRALTARVDFPAARRVLATEADVVTHATVSLMDATGATIVTGVTDATGGVTLTPDATFNPGVGDAYVLEAVKGLGGNALGQDAVRLRTIVQWTANGWVSATSATPGAPVVIDALTTAVAFVSALDAANVPASAVVGKVDASVTPAVLAAAPALTGHPDSEITTLASSVTGFVSGDVDPVAAVKQLTPAIASLSTPSALVGDVLTVSGTGFSALPGGNTVKLGSATATVLLASPMRIVVTVPQLAPGAAAVTVTTATGTSAGSPFIVATPAVTLTGVPSGYVYPGDAITLTGTGFNPLAAANQVLFNGSPVVPTSATPTSLQATVPQGATGPVMVRVPGFSSSPMPLTTGFTQVEAFTATTKRDTAGTTANWGTTGQVTMIPKPAAGTGTEAALSPVASTTIPAGTHNYTSINIPVGVTVTFSGNTTIYCQGACTIAGTLSAKGAAGTPGTAGANLVLSVGGALTVNGTIATDGGNGATTTSNGGNAGNIDLYGGSYAFGPSSHVTAAGGLKGGPTATDGTPGAIRVFGTTGPIAGAVPTPTFPAMPYDTTSTQVVRSLAYDLGGATHPTVVYAGSTVDADVLPGTTITWQFSDSADGTTWGAWTSSVATLTKRYMRFQATLGTTSTTTTPLIRSVSVKYHP